MLIYLVSFILNMLLGFLVMVLRTSNRDRLKKVYLFITTIQYGLLGGFRSFSVGWDTIHYYTIFNSAPSTLKLVIVSNLYVEKGFLALCSLIKIAGGSFQVLLVLVSIFVMASCCIFIFRHSSNVVLSVFTIISFPYFYSSLDIIRHFIAISFILLGYKYILDKRFIKYLLFIFIGSLFHTIAWIFLPLYFLEKVRWNSVTAIITVILTFVGYFYMTPIVDQFLKITGRGSVLGNDWFDGFRGGVKTTLMYLSIVLISILAYENLAIRNQRHMKAVNYSIILFISSVMFLQARMSIRLIMSFIPFLSISMSTLLCEGRNVVSLKNNQIFKMTFILIGCIYHSFMLLTSWQNVVPYIPFWASSGLV